MVSLATFAAAVMIKASVELTVAQFIIFCAIAAVGSGLFLKQNVSGVKASRDLTVSYLNDNGKGGPYANLAGAKVMPE